MHAHVMKSATQKHVHFNSVVCEDVQNIGPRLTPQKVDRACLHGSAALSKARFSGERTRVLAQQTSTFGPPSASFLAHLLRPKVAEGRRALLVS